LRRRGRLPSDGEEGRHERGGMTAVLGVDAAWTAKNASGYALVEKNGDAWRLQAAAPNLRAFSARCGLDGEGQGADHALDCAKHALGCLPDLIAVDMPLSRKEIKGRRASDIGVSKRFGAAKCTTHSPSVERPGKVSAAFSKACEARGYFLITSVGSRLRLRLAEVYPHPALLRLLNVNERVPYKVGKTKTYWRNASLGTRYDNVSNELQKIVDGLENVIAGVRIEAEPALAAIGGFAPLKPAEDMIDAIICAWIGATILEGAAEPIGDEDSAIWIPLPLDRGDPAGAP
jgi:predicted RNase H-like nuclease